MLRLILALPIILTGCLKDETVSGYANPDATYFLAEINGAPFGASASISFPTQGAVRGRGPCNDFSARQLAPYPWLEIGPMVATRATCADQSQENQFFQTLAEMTLIEVLGGTLILRDDGDQEMVFHTARP